MKNVLTMSNTHVTILICIIIIALVVWILHYAVPYVVYVVVRMASLAFYRGKAEAQNYDKKNGENNGKKEEKTSG